MKTPDVNKIDDLQTNIKVGDDTRLQQLVKTFFDTYLNRVEESEDGRLFFPIIISNCRAAMIAPLNDLLGEMETLAGAKPRPEIDNDW